MSKKIIHAIFSDEEILKESAKKLVAKGVKINDVFSPFPIHGIEDIIGTPKTRLSTASFFYGATGTALALLGMWYFMIWDWPMDIGGKPSFFLYMNLPAFIPVTFEFTVLCAAHGMVLTFLFRARLLPGMPARNPDPRTTDDKFLMVINTIENKNIDENEIISLLKETGAEEIKII